MTPEFSFKAVERQEDMPGVLNTWLGENPADPLEAVWVVVSSSAQRQRLQWDLGNCRKGDQAISSNMKFFFPESFVRTVEELTLKSEGVTRHEWRPEALAARLAALSPDSINWTQALAEAVQLDEMVRWRRDTLDPNSMSPLTQQLLTTPEWTEHGPLAQRDRVLSALAGQPRGLPSLIVLYGLENAPGAGEFVKLVQAVAKHASVVSITAYPCATRLGAADSSTGISWWQALDDHLEVWRSGGVDITAVPGSRREGSLGRIQDSLASSPITADQGERANLRVLGAVGAARQVEMARDAVLALLEDESRNLRPEQILLTSPDLSRFIPHLERHWGYNATDEMTVRLPRVAYEITERKASAIRNRAHLIDQVLDLIDNYVSIDHIENLLLFPAMVKALDLEEDSVSRLSSLAREGRVTFGISAEQRTGLELFESESAVGTWQRFLDRLAETAMMPDLDDPDQLGTGNDLQAISGIQSLFRAIEHVQLALKTIDRKSMGDWVAWISEHFGFITKVQGGRDQSFERAVAQITTDFADVEPPVMVSFDLFRDFWHELVAGHARPQTFGNFGVHVAPLSALASSAYDVVVILGLDEENFPAATLSSPTFHPPRSGDPHARNAMLGSLLLSMCSVREELILAFNSRSEISGRPLPTPLVMKEFMEYSGEHVFQTESPRHGFVQRTDLDTQVQSFDYRYAGLGSLVISSPRATSLQRARIDVMSAQTVGADQPETISVKNLKAFLRNAPGDFIARGLRGTSSDSNVMSSDPPRLTVSGLEKYRIKQELIKCFLEHECLELDATTMENILRRESVAADIPCELLEQEINVDLMRRMAEGLQLDIDLMKPMETADENSYYAPIHLACGMTVMPRSGQADERDMWTTYRDYSNRQDGQGGGPLVYDYYASEMGAIKEWRSALISLVDLLVMKVNQPDHENTAPVAVEFFLTTATKKPANPQFAYRYEGSKDEARKRLNDLVELYLRGAHTPLAIGRYTTALSLSDPKNLKGAFEEDCKGREFKMLFGESLDAFLELAREQGVSDLFGRIAQRVSWVRETNSARDLTKAGPDTKPSNFQPLITRLGEGQEL